MIDWAQVTQLCDDVGADEFDEIVEIFLDEVEEVVVKLRDRPSLEELEADMHFLKGSALNLGFSDFSKLCHEGEIEAGQGRAQAVDVPKAIACFYASKAVFLEEFKMRLS